MSHGGESELWRELTGERRAFLSTLPAARGQRRLALAVVLISLAVFLAAAPFAKLPLAPLPAFLPIYQSALVICDLITAVLLFGQFRVLRSRALLMLVAAYLFSAFMAIAHALSFPGLFAPAGLIGAGPQTTAWLYFLWHGGFPLMVIAYALLMNETPKKQDETRGKDTAPGSGRLAAAATVAAVLVAACGLTLLTTAGHDLLPVIMQGNRDVPAKVAVATGSWTLCLVALLALWRRRPHSLLDLWLLVVICAWLFDIALASVLNGGRFDLGWYAGRVYGLLSASFVLVVLLTENAMLYGRLVEAHEGERRERRRVQEKTVQLEAANRELDAFSYSVSHDLRAPLRAIDGYSRMLEEDSGESLGEEGRRLLGVVRSSSHRMGRLIDDLLEFSRLGQKEPARTEIDMTELAQAIVAELAREFPAVRVTVGELPPALADRALLTQVWSNLIGNAFKYSGKRDAAQIEIGARAESAENVYWVRDNGVGFDMRYAAKLFGVFQRLHSQDEFPGTGVGLAIVQRVILRHRGRVWAEARPHEGACFYFSLPREASDAR
jgi:signal transduction histidine kinase